MSCFYLTHSHVYNTSQSKNARAQRMFCIHGIELVCKGKITSQGTRRLNVQLNTPTNTDLVLKSHPAKGIGHYPCSLLCQHLVGFGNA